MGENNEKIIKREMIGIEIIIIENNGRK